MTYDDLAVIIRGHRYPKTWRGWVKLKGLSAYLRVTRRWFPRRGMYDTIDIGSVTAARAGKGSFTRFLDWLEPAADRNDFLVFVEQVLNERLAAFLERRGYARMPNGYLRLKGESDE